MAFLNVPEEGGEVLRQDRLYYKQQPQPALHRPIQTFTRWYAFSSKFPACMIYEL